MKKLRAAAIALVFLGTLTTVGLMGPALAHPSRIAQPPNRQAGKPDLHQNAKPDDTEPKPAPGRMFVTGRVLDPNGKPVPGAAVVAYARARNVFQGPLPNRANAGDAPLGETRADGSGSFRIDALAYHHRGMKSST